MVGLSLLDPPFDLSKSLSVLLGMVLDATTLLLSLCIVWAIHLGFVASTGAPGPSLNTLSGVVGVGPI